MQTDGLKKEDTGLLDHNREPYEELCRAAEKGAALYAACPGSGKSYVVMQYLKDHAGRALVVCPKRAIADAWRDLAGRYGTALDTVTYQLLCRMDEEQVSALMSGYEHFVFDEAHHVGAGRWGANCRHIRDNAGEKSVIGLSATPVRYTDGCTDVGEEFFGGNVVNGITQTEAVETGVLPGFDYVCGVFAFPNDLKEAGAEPGTKLYEKLRHLEYCTENEKEVRGAFDRYLQGRDRKGIVFVDAIENIPEAEGVMKRYFGKGTLMCAIHSRKSHAKNEAALAQFGAAESGWLFAVDMLNEGLHIPGVDTVVMFRKTASPAVYIQQLGRSQAAGAGRAVVFDFIGNRHSLETSGYVPTEERGGTTAERKPDERVIVNFYRTEAVELLEEIYGMLNEAAGKPERFTPEQDAFLMEHYAEHGAKWCSEQPEMGSHTRQSCKVRAAKLGLTGNAPRYSAEEKQFLIENYAKLGPSGCTERLPGRSMVAIQQQAKVLGLTDRRVYSAEEDALIREHYPSEGAKWCAERTGRTEVAIRTRANTLGVRNATAARWTEDEKEYLRDHYTEGPEECAEHLGRTLTACAAKAGKLGIYVRPERAGKQTPHFSEDELKFLEDNYESLGPQKCATALGRSRVACVMRANDMGLSHVGQRRSWTGEEDEFLKGHIDDLDLCAGTLGRSRSSCVAHAHYIGLTVPEEARKKAPWTKDEDAVVREVFADAGVTAAVRAERCAARLPRRTAGACLARAGAIGATTKQ